MNLHKTWLHIGAGSFHRAHQAWYLHRLIASGDASYAIALGNIRDDTTPMLQKLAAQNGEYVLETVDSAGHRDYERITSIKTVIPWDEHLTALVAAGANPDTAVIAFTVTEAGYYLTPALKLDQENPDLKTDLAGGHITIYGALRAILKERIARGGSPVTLLSCDNVRHNGIRFREGFLEFLALTGDDALADWVRKNTTSPCCMVDRITPRPTPDIAPRVLEATGFKDEVPVMGESFIQWVIEDDFIAGRPAVEKVGAEMVQDVQPYEEAKIRILNVSHGCVAWAGVLAGLSFIHEDTLTPAIRQLAYDYVTDDVIPCLTPCPLNLENYRDVVLDRFSNPNIRDTNQRVAADGFSKIPAMVVPTLKECYARGAIPKATAMLPALFLVFLQQWAAGKLPFRYEDGVMNPDEAKKMVQSSDPVAAFVADKALFGELAGREDFTALLREAVERAKAIVAI